MVKLDQHQLDAAEKYHLQAFKLGLKDGHLTDWQLAEAAIAAAHGNYAKAILDSARCSKKQEAEDAQQHLFHFKQIWLIQSRLAGAYAAQGNSLKQKNGSSAASPPLMLALKA